MNAKFKFDEYGKKMDGVTALIYASMNENLEIVKQPINKGADVNAMMSMSAYNFITLDYIALDIATDRKYHKIVEVLKKAGGKFAKEIKQYK